LIGIASRLKPLETAWYVVRAGFLGCAGLGCWAGLGWAGLPGWAWLGWVAGLGWAGLGWAGLGSGLLDWDAGLLGWAELGSGLLDWDAGLLGWAELGWPRRGTWYVVRGTWYVVRGTWYVVRGSQSCCYWAAQGQRTTRVGNTAAQHVKKYYFINSKGK
jgi:hypothetical protein